MNAEQIVASYQAGKTAQSWIITGPEGIGKHQMVNEIAQALLGDKEADLSVGLKIIECGLTEEAKKAVQKAILDGQLPDEDELVKKKSEITVEDIREGINFLSLKSTLPCRILVVSLADEMNEKAQNTLLKTLEEPYDKSLILLLCENMERLLPTIRSRCQKIFLSPLSVEDLTQKIKKEYPDCQKAEKIAFLSKGIPGIAKKIIDKDGLVLYDSFLSVLKPVSQVAAESVLAFAEEVAKDATQMDLIRLLMLDFVAEKAKKSAVTSGYEWSLLYTELQNEWRQMDRLYLDKGQALSEMIFTIERYLT